MEAARRSLYPLPGHQFQRIGLGPLYEDVPFQQTGVDSGPFGLWLAIHVPALRKLLIWLDDVMGYGKRNPVWKWWFDLETEEGVVKQPANTNQRDLQVKWPLPRNHKIALFPAETNPPPGSREAQPIDRVAAQSPSGEDPV